MSDVYNIHAQNFYEKSIQFVTNFGSSYYRLGLIAEKRGNILRAIQFYNTALKLTPNHESVHYRLAQLYLQQGRTEQAEHHLLEFQQLKSQG